MIALNTWTEQWVPQENIKYTTKIYIGIAENSYFYKDYLKNIQNLKDSVQLYYAIIFTKDKEQYNKQK